MNEQQKQVLLKVIGDEGITIIGTYTLRDLAKEFPRYVRFSELFNIKCNIEYDMDKVEDFTDFMYEHVKHFENCKTVADCQIEIERMIFVVKELTLRALVETGDLEESMLDEAREAAREEFETEYNDKVTEALLQMFEEMQ